MELDMAVNIVMNMKKRSNFMININNKPWDKLRLKDIEIFLKDYLIFWVL